MNFFKRLFGRHSKSSQAISTNEKTESEDIPVADEPFESPVAEQDTGTAKSPPPVETAEISADWLKFFESTPLEKSSREFLMIFVGPWPKAVDPNQFSSANWPDLVNRIREYISMPYPGELKDHRAEYKMVDGKVARVSDQFIDRILCSVFPAGEPVVGKPPVIVMGLVKRYFEWPLAKFVFLLPKIHDASEAVKSGKTAVMVFEEMLIQAYKGIENMLFDVYDELPEGGHLSDQAIESKLKSLLAQTD